MPLARIKPRSSLEGMIWLADDDSPSALDSDDREAIRISIRIALESERTFRRLLSKKGPITANSETRYLCDTIRAGIDFFAEVMQAAVVIRGVTVPSETGTMREILSKHGNKLRQLGESSLGLAERLSILLALIHIETLFFGQFWVLHVNIVDARRRAR